MGRIERFLRRLEHKHRQVSVAIASIAIIGLLLIGAGIVAWQSSAEQRRAEALHVHTLDVLLSADEVHIAALEILRGERGYLLTGNRAYLEPYHQGVRRIDAAVDRLDRLTRDNPAQRPHIAALKLQASSYLALVSRIIGLQASGRSNDALATVRKGDGRAAITQFDQTLGTIEHVERQLLAKRSRHAEAIARRNNRLLSVIMLAGCALIGLATLAVIALRKSFAREAAYLRELRRIAETDELTGIANRRELLAALTRAIATARRNRRPLAFAMLDIDHFKQVNDRYGHAAGDAVIRRVGELAAESVRGGDVAGRLGGEEFALVLPDADAQAALQICERLRQTLETEPILLPDGGAITVTISSGVSALTEEDMRDTIVARADHALYSAKNAGRNRVKFAA